MFALFLGADILAVIAFLAATILIALTGFAQRTHRFAAGRQRILLLLFQGGAKANRFGAVQVGIFAAAIFHTFVVLALKEATIPLGIGQATVIGHQTAGFAEPRRGIAVIFRWAGVVFVALPLDVAAAVFAFFVGFAVAIAHTGRTASTTTTLLFDLAGAVVAFGEGVFAVGFALTGALCICGAGGIVLAAQDTDLALCIADLPLACAIRVLVTTPGLPTIT